MPVADLRGAAEDQPVAAAENRQEIIVVGQEKVLLTECVFAFARGTLVVDGRRAPLVVKDGRAALDPKPHIIERGRPEDERAAVIETIGACGRLTGQSGTVRKGTSCQAGTGQCGGTGLQELPSCTRHGQVSSFSGVPGLRSTSNLNSPASIRCRGEPCRKPCRAILSFLKRDK